jgi:L-alanine-DL-glutamate epimerase-like enolase superfamily enzyme
MKITSVEVKHHKLKYKESFSITGGDLEYAPLVFIRIGTDEGLTGVSYAPGSAPFVDGETRESVEAAVARIFAPVLKGQDPCDIERLMTEVDKKILFNNRAKAGVEIALYDLLGKTLNVPLYKLWGGLCKEEVPIKRMVGIASPDVMASKAKDLVSQGYHHLKVKIGKDPKGDVGRIQAIREAVGPKAAISVDANQGYTVKNAIKTLRALEPYDITLAEQPVRTDDLEGLALVRKSVGIPIEVDESVRTLSDALNIIKLGAADFISLKPFKMGGFRIMHKIMGLCEAANVKCLVGTTPGSSLIEAANVHFIASSSYIDVACEIGEFARMQNDPVTGLEISHGVAKVPRGPGLGIQLQMEALEE